MPHFKHKGTIIFFLIADTCVTLFFIATFLIGSTAEQDTKQKSDVLLVLGAGSYVNGEYNPCLKARVEHAVSLYKQQYAPKLLVTGGTDKEDNANEAETMKKIAMEAGVPAEDIILEDKATSTHENFLLSKKILNNQQLNSVIIVTEPFHMPRAKLIAEKQGYTYSVSPATNSPCWVPNKYFTKYFLKEPFAIAAYKLQQKL